MEENTRKTYNKSAKPRGRFSRAVKTVLIIVVLILTPFLLASLFNIKLPIMLFDVGDDSSELQQTGVEDLIKEISVNDAGDTMVGDLVFYNADLRIGANNIVTAGSDLLSKELDILNEGIDYDEITGYLNNDRFSAKSDLIEEGYLDNNDDEDLLTRTQADERFIISGGTDTVLSDMIVDGSITSEDLAENAITTVELADGSVTTAKILEGSVSSEKITDGTIVSLDIADDAVITAKILDGAVTGLKLADGSITLSKLSSAMCSTGEILKKTSLTVWSCVPDASGIGSVTAGEGMSNSGTVADPILDVNVDGTTIEISTDMLRIADGAITSAKLDDGSVTVNKIVDGSVSEGKLANGAVTELKLADNSVTSAKIIDGAISLADIAQNSCGVNQIIKWNGAAWACADDVDTDTNLSESEVEDYIFDGDNTGALSSGTLDLDSLTYIGTIGDAEVDDDISISNLGSVDDGALSANVTLLGASIEKNELTNAGVLGFTWSTSELSSTVMAEGENVSLLTNDSGYITDGNTNWDNSYGFITASSTETLTNKSGNISMWTNDSGYLTSFAETDPTLTNDNAVTLGNGALDMTLTFDSDAGIDGTVTYQGATDTFSFNGSLSATGYNNTNWDTAYGWGDHSTQGYITDDTSVPKNHLVNSGVLPFTWSTTELVSTVMAEGENVSLLNNDAGYLTSFTETDPQVGENTLNYIPKWDGSALVTGTIYDDGNVGIGTASPGQLLTVEGTFGLLEGGTSPTYHTIFQGGDQSSDISYTLPTADATTFNQVLASNASGVLSWIDGSGIAGGLWTDGGAITYLTSTTDDWAVGGTDSSASLFFDESAGDLRMDGNVNIGLDAAQNYLYFEDGVTDQYLSWDDSTFLLSNSLLSSADDTYDLGATGSRWQDLYLGPTSLHIGTSATDEALMSYDTTNDILEFSTDSTTNADISFFDDNLYLDKSEGRIGIGTTAPSKQLEITGSFEIPDTTHADESGIIYKNGVPFIHNFNYGDNGTVTTTGHNTFVGKNAGNFTMGSTATAAYQGSFNSAMGYNTLNSNTTGYDNLAMGYNALHSNTTGYRNSAIGPYVLYSNTTGFNNSAMGLYTLHYNNTGYNNSAIGFQAMMHNTTGYRNSAMGSYSLQSNTTGYYNSAMGYFALYNVKPTSKAITAFADYSATVAGTVKATSVAHGLTGTVANIRISGTTNYNGVYTITVIDADSFYFTDTWVSDDATGWWGKDTEGRYNTAFGYQAGDNITTGSNNLIIGYNVDAPSATGDNQLNIGDTIYGDLSTGYVGIGTTGPGYPLEISSSLNTFRVNKTTDGGTLASFGGEGDVSVDAPSISGGRFIIKDDGNVGIGTAGPTRLLDVRGDSSKDSSSTEYTAYINNYGDVGCRNGLLVQAGYITSTTDIIAKFSAFGAAYAEEPRMVIKADGNVGIGTTGPGEKLEVNGNIEVSGTGGYLKLPDVNGNEPTCNSSNEGIIIYDTSSGSVEKSMYYCGYDVTAEYYQWIRLKGDYYDPDLAEYIYSLDKNINYGDIVAISDTSNYAVEKASNSNGQKTIGIISTDPGITLGQEADTIGPGKDTDQIMWDNGFRPLTLAGRIPTKVSTVNGQIKNGDRITVSFEAGIGQLATKAGINVGQALESFNPVVESCQKVNSVNDIDWEIGQEKTYGRTGTCYITPDGTIFGKIMVFVNVSWYEPEEYLSKIDQIISDYDDGLLTGSVASIPSDLVVDSIQAQIGTFTQLSGETLSIGNGELEIDALGNLVTTGNLSAVNITGENLFANSLEVQELVAKENEDIGVVLGDSAGSTGFTISDSDGNPLVRIDSEGNIIIGTDDPRSILKVEGYLQIDSDVEAPLDEDCDEEVEEGKTFYESDADILWICQGDGGWKEH